MNNNNNHPAECIEVQLHLELSQICNERFRDKVFRDLVETLCSKMYQAASAKLEVNRRGHKICMEFSNDQAPLPYVDLAEMY